MKTNNYISLTGAFLFFLSPLSAQTILMQNGETEACSGSFYDSGGAGGSYSNHENYLLTIHPTTPGNCLRLTFNSFNTHYSGSSINGPDALHIFDGLAIDSTKRLLWHAGTANPGTITSTSGPLTLYFASDEGTTRSGWDASVSCVPCGVGSPSITTLNGDYFAQPDTIVPGKIYRTDGYTSDEEGHFCARVENNKWYKFRTLGTTVSFDINVFDCDGTPYGNGIQASVYQLGIPTAPINECYGVGATGMNTFTFTGLVYGANYLLMIDGYFGDLCDYTIAPTGTGPLAVEWESLGSRPAGKGLEIYWTTSTETNTDYFVVERGDFYYEQGEPVFEPVEIASLDPEPDQSYQYIDLQPQKNAWYRIREVDKEGRASYSPLIEASHAFKGSTFELHPNPAVGGETYLVAELEESREALVTVYDLQGRTVLELNAGLLEQGYVRERIDVSGLERGVYVFQVYSHGKISSGKLVVGD